MKNRKSRKRKRRKKELRRKSEALHYTNQVLMSSNSEGYILRYFMILMVIFFLSSIFNFNTIVMQ